MFFKKDKQESFPVIDKKVHLLTLDQRWHELFPKGNKPRQIQVLEKKLNKMLAEQGKLNNELKEYTLLKKKMMSEIVEQMEDAFDNENDEAMKQLTKNKKYIDDINAKVEAFEERLDIIPDEINEINKQLLNISMQECYNRIQTNKHQLDGLEQWIKETREALKNKIIIKDELVENNQKIYSYMHDLLGYEIIEHFDESFWSEKND